jgi:hypothetical protein
MSLYPHHTRARTGSRHLVKAFLQIKEETIAAFFAFFAGCSNDSYDLLQQ